MDSNAVVGDNCSSRTYNALTALFVAVAAVSVGVPFMWPGIPFKKALTLIVPSTTTFIGFMLLYANVYLRNQKQRRRVAALPTTEEDLVETRPGRASSSEEIGFNQGSEPRTRFFVSLLMISVCSVSAVVSCVLLADSIEMPVMPAGAKLVPTVDCFSNETVSNVKMYIVFECCFVNDVNEV